MIGEYYNTRNRPVYDYRGRRSTKAVETLSGSTWNIVLSNKFVYDGWNLVSELNGTNNAVIRCYMWGSDLSGSMQGAGGVGGLLAISSPGSAQFTCFDGNGNITALIDATSSAVSGLYEYGPFGEILRITGSACEANPFRFSTKYQDDETDLAYYGYRYYNASTGGWLSRDLVAEEGGANLYGFVGDDGINKVDYLGLMKDTEVDSYVRQLGATVRKEGCCCKPDATQNTLEMTFVPSGATVTGTADFHGGKCVDRIDSYFWWDCFKAQQEYKKIVGSWVGNWKIQRGDLEWQQYGWLQDKATHTRTEHGNPGVLCFLGDSAKWYWQVRVVYVECNGDRPHANTMLVEHELHWVAPVIFDTFGTPTYGEGSWAR
jgi:RHS repeat-associated protein